MFTRTFAAIATAAVLAAGSVAIATPAQAGHHGGFVVKFKGHGHFGHGGYGHGYGYGHVYVPTCFIKHVQVWTYHGPAIVAKKVCH
jgi:hypothetical protein